MLWQREIPAGGPSQCASELMSMTMRGKRSS
jgi:hypothetical protein